MVSVSPVSSDRRWMPDWPVSNGEKRYRPLRGPVSLTVIMSHAPLFGSPAASWAVRFATDRCRMAGFPKVIGLVSSAVGPADDVSGVKSEKRALAAAATPPAVRTAASTRLPATKRRLVGNLKMVGTSTIGW